MQVYEYVKKEEWQPVRDELYEIIHKLQDEVKLFPFWGCLNPLMVEAYSGFIMIK